MVSTQVSLDPLCLVQYDDRVNTPQHSLGRGRAHNRALCQASHFPCNFLTEADLSLPALPGWPVFWLKVAIIQQLLEYRSCAMVIWLDSDVLIHSDSSGSRISALTGLLSNKSMFISANPPCWNMHSSGAFCAGVFGIRRSAIGLQLVRDWMALYPRSAWLPWTNSSASNASDASNASKANVRSSSWACNLGRKKCIWSGPQYEQGAFAKWLLPRYREAVEEVSSCKLNIPCTTRGEATRRGALTCHFMGRTKSLIGQYLRSDNSQTINSLDQLCDHKVTAVKPPRIKALCACMSWEDERGAPVKYQERATCNPDSWPVAVTPLKTGLKTLRY